MRGLLLNAEWAPKNLYHLSREEKEKKIAYRGNMVWKNPTYSVEKNLPEPVLNDCDVLIEVASCGVCGSDINILAKDLEGYILFSGECSFPVILGHEFSGKIVEVGRNVKSFNIGDVVTAEECQWCGECNPCRAGWFNQCSSLNQLGFYRGNNGAFADYVVVNEKYCWSLEPLRLKYNNEEKVLEAGSLIEPTAVAYEGIFSIGKGFLPGGHVVIFGAGPIGLAAIQLVRASGAAKIIVFEPKEVRKNMAITMGADHVFNPLNQDGTEIDIIMDITHGEGVSLAIEAAGSFSINIPKIERLIGVGGKIIMIGMSPEYPRIDPIVYQNRAGCLYGSLGHAGHSNFKNVINLMASGRIDMLQTITARYSLDNAVEAIMNADNEINAKVLIKP
jgi:threonine dehydrogenase-like Zn-dependent dehydrogenase